MADRNSAYGDEVPSEILVAQAITAVSSWGVGRSFGQPVPNDDGSSDSMFDVRFDGTEPPVALEVWSASSSRCDTLDAVVSVSAPAHPGDLMRKQMDAIPQPVLDLILSAVQRMIGYQFDEFAPRVRIGLVNAPIMLVHGSSDTMVPIDNLYELAAAQSNADVVVVPNGGHSDLKTFEHHVGTIIDFFNRHLRQQV